MGAAEADRSVAGVVMFCLLLSLGKWDISAGRDLEDAWPHPISPEAPVAGFHELCFVWLRFLIQVQMDTSYGSGKSRDNRE